MKQLYKITDDYKDLIKLVESGQATQADIADTIDGVSGMLEEKAQNIVHIASEYQQNIDIIEAEIDRLTDMKKSISSKRDSLKEYLRINMEKTGISKIECPLFEITLRKASAAVQINDEKQLPDDFVTVKTTVSPDKRAILKALKEGVEVSGAEITYGKASILIK